MSDPRIQPSFPEGPNERAHRRRLADALARDAGFSDEGAELDSHDLERRLELVSGNDVVDRFVVAAGLDPQDPWRQHEKVSGANILVQALGYDPRSALGPHVPEFQEFDDYAQRLEAGVVGAYRASKLSGEVLVSSLKRHADPRSAQGILEGVGRGHLFEGHFEAVTSLIRMGGDLDVAVYDFNSPRLLAEIANRASLSNVRVTTDPTQFHGGRQASMAVHKALSSLTDRGLVYNEEKTSFVPTVAVAADGYWRNHLHDHFKLVVARGETREQRGMWLGSANFTRGAMGAFGRRGFNLERSFFLNYEMVQKGAVSEALFDALVAQAGTAAEYAHRRQFTPGQLDFGNTGGFKTRLLTNEGFAAEARELFGRTDLVRALVFANRFGKTGEEGGIRRLIADALTRGVEIQVLVGGVHAEKEQARLAEFAAGLDPAQRGLLRIVTMEGSNIHAKGAAFEFKGGGVADLSVGSTNWADSSMLGGKASWSPLAHHRNVNLVTYSHHPDTGQQELSSTAAAYQATANVFAMAALTRKASVGLTGYATKYTIGGVIHAGGGVFDLGRLQTVSAGVLDPDYIAKGFGFEGQFFVPELTKFVGGVAGYSHSLKGEDAYARDFAPGRYEFGALEVLGAGVTAVNEMLAAELEDLVHNYGLARVQAAMADPVMRGRMKVRAREMTRRVFEHFQGLEPGMPAYNAKAFVRLGYRIDSAGGLDMLRAPVLDAVAMDWALSKGIGFGFGGRELFFMAGGLSRYGKEGGASPPRFYDAQALVRSLPVGYVGRTQDGRSDYFFLMPLTKLMQLPQRLQNIVSARNLDPVEDEAVLRGLGVTEGGTDLYSTSRFVGEDGRALRGVRFRGVAIPGMTGDNAYVVDKYFENAYFGDAAIPHTIKMRKSSVVTGDPGRVFVDEIRRLGRDHADVIRNLGGDRYLLTAAALEMLGHRVDAGRSYIGDTMYTMMEQMPLRTDGTKDTGFVVDLAKDVSLVDAGNYWHLTVAGTTVRRAGSGDRGMIGGKFPFSMVQAQSPAIVATQRALQAINPAMYNQLRLGEVNAVFGTGVFKTGQAYIETGIEVLSTGAFREQLAHLRVAGKLNSLAEFEALTTRLAGFVENEAVAKQMRALAPMLHELGKKEGAYGPGDRDVYAALLERLAATEFHLRTNQTIAIKGGSQHVAGAALAFGVHALYYHSMIEQARAAGVRDVVALHGAFGSGANPLSRLSSFATMSDQMLVNPIPVTWTGAVSSTAVAMSSRNRVNFLAYHLGGYTQAFYDMMAAAPSVRARSAAFTELVTGGLLGRGGDSDVLLGWEYAPLTRYASVGKVTVGGKEIDPFAAMVEMHTAARDVFGGGARGGNADAAIVRAYAMQERYEGLAAAVEAKKAHALETGTPLYRSTGSAVSTDAQAMLWASRDGGMGSHTVIVPKIGKMVEGRFVFDAGAGITKAAVAQMQAVRFLSATALQTLGAFEKFSHEISKLQTDITRDLWVLEHLRDRGGVITSTMGLFEQDVYKRLLTRIGELEEKQKLAAVSDLQKLMGGALALKGHNVVAGTMPEIRPGTIVVGQDAWDSLKARAVAEVKAGISGGLMGAVTTVRKDGTVVTRPENFVEGLQRYIARTLGAAGIPDSLGFQKRLVEGLDSSRQAAATEIIAKQRAVSTDLDYQFKMLEQGIAEAETTLRETKARYSGLYNEIDATYKGHFDELRARQRQQIEAARGDVVDSLVEALNDLAENKRATLARLNAKLEGQLGAVDAHRAQMLGAIEAEFTARMEAITGDERAFAASMEGEILRIQSELRGAHAQTWGLLDEVGRTRRQVWLRDRLFARHRELERKGQGETPGAKRLLEMANRAANTIAARNERLGPKASTWSRLEAAAYQARAGELLVELGTARELVAENMGAPAVERRVGAQRERQQQVQYTRSVTGQMRVAVAEGDRGVRRATFLGAERREHELRVLAFRGQTLAEAEIRGQTQLERDTLRAEMDLAKRHLMTTREAAVAPILAELKDLRQQLAALKRGVVGTADVNAAIEAAIGEMFEHQGLRRAMGGMAWMQRSGAPMGPEAMLLARIMKVDEYNALGPGLLLSKEMGKRGTWMNVGAMGLFLGDFDGDTAGIGLLSGQGLQADVVLEQLNAVDAARLTRVEQMLRWSPEEVAFTHSRHYTSWNQLFDERLLYQFDDHTRGLGLEGARAHLHGLEAKVEAGARAMGVYEPERLYGNDKALDIIFQGDTLGRRQWTEFGRRKAMALDLATSANAYTNAMFETHRQVQAHVESNWGKRAGPFGVGRQLTAEELYQDYFTTRAGKDSLSALMKSAGVLTDQGKVGAEGIQALTHNQLLTFFTATSVASTTIISKTFESVYAVESYAQAVRASHRQAMAVGIGDIAGKEYLTTVEAEVEMARLVEAGDSRAVKWQQHMAAIDARQADVAGIGLGLQQIAREAIKPKGSTDLLAEVRGEIGNDAKVVASAIKLVKRQARTQGLDWYQRLLTGRGFFDEAQTLSEHATIDQKLKAHAAIKKGFVDYYGGQLGAVSTSLETLRRELGHDLPQHIVDILGDIGDDPEAREARKQALSTYIDTEAGSRAWRVVELATSIRALHNKRQEFLQAIESGDEVRYGEVAGKLSMSQKLHFIATTAARGKFESSEGMAMALHDVFSYFQGVGPRGALELRQAASSAAGTEVFANNMVEIFEAYQRGGNMQQALLAGARRSKAAYDAKESEFRERLREHIEHSADFDEAAKTAAREKTSAQDIEREVIRPRERSLAEAHGPGWQGLGGSDQFKEARAQAAHAHLYERMLADRGEVARTHPGFDVTRGRTGATADTAMTEIAGHGGAMLVKGGVIAPLLLATGVFGAGVTAMPGAAHASTGDVAGAVGEAAGMALAFARPEVMIAGIAQGPGSFTEKAAMAASVSLGVGAGSVVSQWTYDANIKRAMATLPPGLDEHEIMPHAKRAGFGASLASAVAGAFVGGVVGLAATAIFQKFGLISEVNPVAESLGALVGLELDDPEAGNAEVEELLGLEDGENAEGVVEIRDASGEIIHQDFYRFDHAQGGDGYDAHAVLDADLDTHVLAVSVDETAFDEGDAAYAGDGGRNLSFAKPELAV